MINTLPPRSLLKIVTLTLLVVIIARFKTEQCSKNWNYQIVRSDGPSLPPEEIISSHNVEPTVQVNCNYLCYQEPKCVGFNFRIKTNDKYALNCQLTNTTKRRNKIEKGDWTLFHMLNSTTKNENELKEAPAAVLEKDCADIYKSGVKQSGVYTIEPDGLGSFQVWCDMLNDDGGWTVFQRRQDASVDFYRGWQDYRNGFGSLNGNFWLGLDKIHRLTKSVENVLRIDLMDFDLTRAYAKYGIFFVASESQSYKLNVGIFSGNAGNSLISQNGKNFTTKDRDNDVWVGNCAVNRQGAWWYYGCTYSNLNGVYLNAGQRSVTGIQWHHWKYDSRSMNKTEMKIRAVQL